MQLIISRSGDVRCIYGEAIDLEQLGQLTIRRGSYVEPDSEGQWIADLEPVAGPRLGPFANRSQALHAEEAWLLAHWLFPPFSRSAQGVQDTCRGFIFSLPERSTMKVLFINNDGGGFADHIEVAEGTTVRQMFQQQVSYGKPDNYLIRVNRQPVSADQVLQEGDRVSFTPTKIEGAS